MVWTPKAWERSVCLGHQHMALLGGEAWWKRVVIPCAIDGHNKTSPSFLSLLHKHHTVSKFLPSHSLAVTIGLKPQIITDWNCWSWSQSIPSFLKGCLAQIHCYNNAKWLTQKTGTGSGVVDVVMSDDAQTPLSNSHESSDQNAIRNAICKVRAGEAPGRNKNSWD